MTARQAAPRLPARAGDGGPSTIDRCAVPSGSTWTTRSAVVDVTHRLAWLLHAGTVEYGPVPVALGRPGQETPTGRFHVVWKDREHVSGTYGIRMDYAVFFASGGIAFHEGPLDAPSHGCVHLRRADAARFFNILPVGARVEITGRS